MSSSRRSARSTGAARSALGSRLGWLATITVISGASAWLVARTLQSVAGDRYAPWLIGRAAGISCYLFMVALVGLGLILAHPWRARIAWPSAPTRIRIHIGLAVFTLALLVLHAVTLATDDYAKVGWDGALIPLRSEYRAPAVSMGVLGAYLGLIAGVTALGAGRWAQRIWWPIHKVAAACLVLVWFHAILAGSDSAALMLMYVVTGAVILVLAATRHLARPAARTLPVPAPIDGL